MFDSAVGFDYGKVGGDGWDGMGWMEAAVLGWWGGGWVEEGKGFEEVGGPIVLVSMVRLCCNR